MQPIEPEGDRDALSSERDGRAHPVRVQLESQRPDAIVIEPGTAQNGHSVDLLEYLLAHRRPENAERGAGGAL
ncbi:hypothetical protein [Rhodococcus sp. USK13]|uniref:hypothetical protein n=1 Tax=Rhodococcus sp. USK13 TaxID=2806442 RepID=UPI001BD068D4|nr:hypothetical protein [Rhodococcus sp. USK13]